MIDENDILHEKLRGQDETIDSQTKQQRSYNKNSKCRANNLFSERRGEAECAEKLTYDCS